MEYYIGVDISKQTLDVFDGDRSYQVLNNSGLKDLRVHLREDFKKSWKDVLCIFEPTGPYTKALRDFCKKHEIRVYEVNPKQSASFARALGNRSKTDKVDAKMLRDFSKVLNPSSFSIPSKDIVVEKLSSLLSSYEFILKSKTRIQNHLSSQKLGGDLSTKIQSVLNKELKLIEKTETTIIQEMEEMVKEDSNTMEAYQNLISMPGIGTITAVMLIYFFKRYPNANRSEITALAGLDPKRRESGTSLRGKVRISKAGYSLLRKIMYFSCMCSIRSNDRLKKYYLHLLENHKIPKVALIACMKKMLLIAHQLYLKKEHYMPLQIEIKSCC
jgi:transposase